MLPALPAEDRSTQGALPGPSGDISTEAPGQNANAERMAETCQSKAQATSLDAKAIDQWWEAWWRHPILGDVTPTRTAPKRRMSLRHGVDKADIAEYVRRLGNEMMHQLVGRHSTWLPATPRLDEWFSPLRVLGQGHYGTARLCEEKWTGERFACKTILKSSIVSIEEVNELCTEVLTMLLLQAKKVSPHDNLVHFWEIFDDDEAVHLIMDYCDGGDLFDRISKYRRLSEKDTAHIFKDLVQGVLRMHSLGIVHRDLKPENIFLTRSRTSKGPRVKVGDFGLSIQLHGTEKTKGPTGTLFYVAPEVISNLEYDSKADVWSLGAILFTCLSGRLPFWGEDDDSIIRSVLAAKPSFAKKPWPRISYDVKLLILGMLHPDPAKRMSLHDVLTHDWLAMHTSEEEPRESIPHAASKSLQGSTEGDVPKPTAEESQDSGMRNLVPSPSA